MVWLNCSNYVVYTNLLTIVTIHDISLLFLFFLSFYNAVEVSCFFFFFVVHNFIILVDETALWRLLHIFPLGFLYNLRNSYGEVRKLWMYTFFLIWFQIMFSVTASLVEMLNPLLKTGGSTTHLFYGTMRSGTWLTWNFL